MSTAYSVDEACKMGFDVPEITAYIEKEWSRPLAMSQQRFYAWNFRRVPQQGNLDHCIILADSEQQIAGFVGLNRRPFYLQGQELNGVELTTWFISEHARGKGGAKQMVDFLKSSCDVFVGMGSTEMALNIQARLGFRYIRYIPRYVRIFNEEKVLGVSEASSLGRKMVRQYRGMSFKMDYKVEETDFSDGFPESGALHQQFNCFSRSSEYLAWRYGEHPVYHHRVFRVRSGKHTAVLVIRVDQSEHLSVAHVMDLFGAPEAFAGAVAFVDEFCRDGAVDMADFYCVSDHVGHHFWGRGWFSMVDDYYLGVPHLYYPLEVRKPPTTSMVMWCKYDDVSFLDRGLLYVTKQDCDLDRPTQAYLDVNGWR